MNALDYAPVAATVFAVPQFLPQILKLRATRDPSGVSWAWATLTCLNNAAWLAYFALEHYWTALVPSSSAPYPSFNSPRQIVVKKSTPSHFSTSCCPSTGSSCNS